MEKRVFSFLVFDDDSIQGSPFIIANANANVIFISLMGFCHSSSAVCQSINQSIYMIKLFSFYLYGLHYAMLYYAMLCYGSDDGRLRVLFYFCFYSCSCLLKYWLSFAFILLLLFFFTLYSTILYF